jgi:protein gp37
MNDEGGGAMGKQTEIEWCDASWNPWYGCRKVSVGPRGGCTHCYVEREMRRYGLDFLKVTRAKDATFRAPLKWKEPMRIFTCSWSDWFIEQADPWRAEAWEIIRQTPQHTYMILTKRPERIMKSNLNYLTPWAPWGKPWPNVWLGVSVENQEQADKRIPLLLTIPAAVRFVSYEPALGPVNFAHYFTGGMSRCSQCGTLYPAGEIVPRACPKCHGIPTYEKPRGLDWLIIGGESGPEARELKIEWADETLEACRAAGVPCFIKQMGSNPTWRGERIEFRHPKGGDMAEWPEALRVREWPEVKR